jgi:hypothetical protein
MAKRWTTVARSLVAACLLAALAVSLACNSDEGGAPKDRALQQPQKPKPQPAFAEAAKASLTHKGRTLDFQSAVASMSPDSKVLEVFFYPYKLTDAQKASLLKGDETPRSVNYEGKGHDPAGWPHKPIFALKIGFKDGKTHTVADVARCSLAIEGWEAAGKTSHIPLESTVEALKLGGRKTGEKLLVKGSAKGRYGDPTKVTFEADTILVVPAF